MTLPSSTCSHCGEIFCAHDSPRKYSVFIDSNGYLVGLVEDELVPDALHYCSEICMFNREQGIVPLFKYDYLDAFPIQADAHNANQENFQRKGEPTMDNNKEHDTGKELNKEHNKEHDPGKEHHREQDPGTGYYKGKDHSTEHLKNNAPKGTGKS